MKKLIVANWKCNPVTLQEAKKLFDSIKRGIKNLKNACPEQDRRAEVVICPPFVYLTALEISKYQNIAFGAQDCFWEEKGAYTGEISPAMLKNLGVDYVIIGHSERRKYQKETDEMLNKKLKAGLQTGLKVILCIDNISRLKKDLSGLAKKELSNLIIAYEPIFAIGTGKPCSIEKAKKMRRAIKKEVFNRNIPILYGGSVNSQNAVNYIREGGFQGLLIGGASLNIKEFLGIIKNIDLVLENW